MTQDEYLTLLGKHRHAVIELAKASRESMRAYDDVQSWANGLLINKLDEQYAIRGHLLIDSLLERKQLEDYWKAEEMRLLEALDGQVK
jgi:hypothetical protein